MKMLYECVKVILAEKKKKVLDTHWWRSSSRRIGFLGYQFLRGSLSAAQR